MSENHMSRLVSQRNLAPRLLRCAAVACAALCLGFTARADIPASAYVQDGLIAQWDGIENAGAGVHDESLTEWKDLSGNGHHIALPDSGIVVGSDSLKLSKTKLMTKIAEFKEAGTFHGEACAAADEDYKASDTTRSLINNPQLGLWFRNTGNLVGGVYRKSADNKSYYWYAPEKPTVADIKVRHTYSVSSSSVGSTYSRDGAPSATISSTFWDKASTLNEDVSFGSTDVTLNYCSVRIYNRALTAEEIAINSNIDKMRFAGAEPAELTWPEGCRWNADKQCVEYRVSAQGVDGATVSLDGETFAEKVFTDWFSEGEAIDVTITARPVQDRVIRWEGAPAEAFASGNRISFAARHAARVEALAAEPRTFHWLGRSANANVASNWDLGDIPRQGDSIVLDSGSNPMTWNLPSGAFYGSWTQTAGYTGEVSFDTGLSEVRFSGDVILEGGSWTHTANPSFVSTDEAWQNGRGTKHLIVRTDGNMTVAANVSVHANGKGFGAGKGPGKCSQFANHGGRGADWYNSTDMTAMPPGYGSVTAPDTIGSGGSNAGGGAIRLTVVGTLTVDGTVESRGTASTHYTGASGSVDISCGKLAGSGKIDADATSTTTAVHGGAGRVAVKLTQPDSAFSDFAGRITAAGGTPGPVSPGTVYLETAAQAGGHGELLVIGSGNAQRQYNSTDVAGPYSYDFSRIVISNYAALAICSNANVTCRKLCVYGTSQSCVAIDGGELHLPSGTTVSNFTLKVWHPGSVLTVGDTNDPETVVFENGSVAVIDASLVVSSLQR